ncbi:MAG: ABC transporter ATP-binding protein [Candidatus Kapabacteria bacterium]|jgi:ABC-type multidrug transport system ATPase subunit|nr:ABC transporter ATP-binding protein [Candidatus Kapabacteria bacterium]
MTSIKLLATSLGKSFGGRSILKDISCSVSNGECLGIVGDNGSGKSTLVRILAGILRPDVGSVVLSINGVDIAPEDVSSHIGFVAPYLRPYDEFTPLELLRIHDLLTGRTFDADACEATIRRVGLTERSSSLVRTFSSGQRQRMLLALALQHRPRVLILDEPSVTLDTAGRAIVEDVVRDHCLHGGCTILATNDDRELDLCTSTLSVQP